MDVVLTSGARLEAVTLKEVEAEELDAALSPVESFPLEAATGISVEKSPDTLISDASADQTVPVSSTSTQPASTFQTKSGASGAQVAIGDNNELPGEMMGELWKAIEPCWKRLADKDTAGVVMRVSFTQLGNPAVTPATGLKGDRSASESLAINALAECGPYLMVYGQDNVQIAFPAGG